MLSRSELEHKRKVIQAAKLLRKKFSDYKRDVQEAEKTYFHEHKQVIQPLQQIVENIKTSSLPIPLPQPSTPRVFATASSTPPAKKIKLETPKREVIIKKEKAEVEEYGDEDYDGDEDDSDVNKSKTTEYNVRQGEQQQEQQLQLPTDLISKQYANILQSDDINVDRTRYGIKYIAPDIWRFGGKDIYLRDNNFILDNELYAVTPGLFNLLTLKNPTQYTEKDVENYALLVLNTNAHRKEYKDKGALQKLRSFKFTNILKPSLEKIVKRGGGLFKKLNDSNDVEYIYWQTVPELMKRFRLLWASKWAGNNSHNNEIRAVENVFRDLKLIA